MKVLVKNLGRIKSAEIDLKPFTVFIGNNNTNKTWLTYMIYGVLDTDTISSYVENNSTNKGTNYLDDDFFNQLFTNSYVTIDLEAFILKNSSIILNDLSNYFSEKLTGTFFGVSDNSPIGQATIGISLGEKDIQSILKVMLYHTIDEYDVTIGNLKTFIFKKNKNNSKLEVSYKDTQNGLPINLLKKVVIKYLLIVVTQYIGRIGLLPSERQTLSVLYQQLKGPSVNEIFPLLEKYLINKEEKGAFLYELSSLFYKLNLPKPILDYIELLQKADKSNELDFNVLSQTVQDDIPIQLSNILEQKIIGGKVEFIKQNDNSYLSYIINRIAFSLSYSSSMVKSLSALNIYLRYAANAQDVLIIDEPEMSLHPEAIVKLTEFFGVLVNSKNISLIINTHSPYIIDHLVNLLEAYHLSDDEKTTAQDLFFLKTKGAFINPDNFAAYLFEENEEGDVEVKSIFDRENITINWDSFSNVSDKISNIYFKLPQKNAV